MRDTEIATTGVLAFKNYLLIVHGVVISLSFFGLPNAEIKAEEDVSPSEGQEFICAEQCAVDRDLARKRCEIIYDEGLCFGYLPCIDDTETALRHCENIANTIHFGCASRCYKNLLESKVDE